MEEEENFDIDWLNERYPFDAEARNKVLKTSVLNYLETKKELILVDVVAGTGSNCLYFVEQLSQNQKWYLIEEKDNLKNATIRRFKDFATYHKYNFDRKKDILQITSSKKHIEIILLNEPLMNLSQSVNLTKVDLVLANAGLELLSQEQLETFAQTLLQAKVPLYTTLNYKELFFDPEDPFDEVFLPSYNDFLTNKSATVKTIGSKAIATIQQLFENENWTIETGKSIWQVEKDDIKMHYYLLSFLENALEDGNLDTTMQANFKKWLQRKKDLIITRRQHLEVRHIDVFARF